MVDLSGKVAIITGATGFLASGVVPLFRDSRANLVLPGDTTKLIKRFPELKDDEQHLLSSASDLSNPDVIEELVSSSIAKFGRIDILVNIVGGWDAGKPVHETDIDTWDNMMLLNSKITFLVSRAVIPSMIEQRSGKIVNIGAKPGIQPGGNDAAYAASKAAMLRLTESMSKEYKKHGININAVLPSAIISSERYAEDPTAGVTPQQIGKVIAFLASDDASIIHGAFVPAYGLRF